MDERQPLPVTPAVLAALAMLFGAYVGGYFWLGTRTVVIASELVAVEDVVRLYPHKWQVAIFQPAAYVESLCIGVKVVLIDGEPYSDPNGEEP